MTWWQSLLIALIPAIITATISWLICNKQIQNARKEQSEKYAMEKRNHVSKIRFEKEFSIYQELSEKFITMVMDTCALFPQGLYYEPVDEQEKEKYYKEFYSNIQESYNQANKAVNKYAIFIPEKWYDKFMEIRTECHLQARLFYALNFAKTLKKESDKVLECFNRTKRIEEMTRDLKKDLRKYIEELDVKEKHNGD